jgi:hypothetical protein
MLTRLTTPLLAVVLSFLLMWLSVWAGVLLRKRQQELETEVCQDLELILASTLTLLGLIIGFSFSMAINRYDQRKNYEEAEANAIGTEYLRADMLPASDAARVRALLREYLDQRIRFYEARDEQGLQRINDRTAQLQAELWSGVQGPATAQPSPVLALVLSGMNDVLNSQGYTQAAWWNRIPIGAWGLMATVATCSCMLFGYIVHRAAEGFVRLMILPIVLSIAFFLVADIDSPRRGAIRVLPRNLISLAESLRGR